MHLSTSDETLSTDFRAKATLRIAAASLVLFTPFVLTQLLHNQLVANLGMLAITGLSGLCFWGAYRSQHRQWLILLVLVPALLGLLAWLIKNHGINNASWLFPVVIAYYCMLEESKAWLANLITLTTIIPVIWWSTTADTAFPFIASMIAVSLFSSIGARVTNSHHQSLETLATTDTLTGLLNRSLLKITLSQAIDQFRRAGTPMTLLFIDLDHFKLINDTYGHATGDQVLAQVGGLIKDTSRLSDTCFRLGGEEFLCLLYGSDLANGKRLAETLRQRIQASRMIDDQQVTASVGVASLESGENHEDWYKRVDDHVYSAKHNGRNRVSG